MQKYSLSLSRNPPLTPKQRGFTLLEILLVVGIIAILAGIVIVAINPSKQLAQVRNTERKSDIKQLDSAITQYYIDNFEYPSDIDGTLTGICNTGSLSTTTGSDIICTNLVDLTVLVPDYITAIPTDPQSTTTNTGYYVKEDSITHKLITQATLAELSQTIGIGVVASTTEVVGGSTLGDGLVLHYKMNDTNGTTVDDTSISNNDGLGTYTHVAGHVGSGAFSFNGDSNEISFSDSGLPTGDSDRSFSFWINLNSYGDWMNFIKYGTDNNGLGVAVTLNNNGRILLGTYGDGADASSLSEVGLNGWRNIIVTFNHSNYTVSYYLDGLPDGTATITTVHGNPNTVLSGSGYLSSTS